MIEKLVNSNNKMVVLFIILMTILLTGINGLIAFLLFMIFSRFDIGRDPDIKHGLSSGTSRLGGIAILLN